MNHEDGECSYCHKPLVLHESEEGLIGNYHYQCWQEWRWEMQADADMETDEREDHAFEDDEEY